MLYLHSASLSLASCQGAAALAHLCRPKPKMGQGGVPLIYGRCSIFMFQFYEGYVDFTNIDQHW